MADLRDISNYVVGVAGIRIARQVIERLQSTCDLLATTPGQIGVERPELGEGIRSFPVPPHIIFFKYGEAEIRVARFLHQRRDIPNVFEVSEESS